MAAAAFFVTKRFVLDVWIIIKGTRYNGVCTSKFGFRNGDCCVEWKDSENVLNKGLFSVTTFRKPPFVLPVYSIDNEPKMVNLGLRSILYYLPLLVITDFTFILLVFGAIPEYLSLIN